jgi:hypothetical protein
LPELLEQVVNATVYFERKLDVDEEPAGALVNEYYRVQKAFYEKMKPAMDNDNFVRSYGRLVELLDCRLDVENLRMALATAKQYLNVFCNTTYPNL